MDFKLCEKIITNISKVIVGKYDSLELLMVGMLADGHVLLEDVPGIGKTLIAKSLAKSIGGSFKRVQFTPDLLPSDITGFNVYNQQTGRPDVLVNNARRRERLPLRSQKMGYVAAAGQGRRSGPGRTGILRTALRHLPSKKR